jgi:flagellar biosynthesis GTPase FlhF
LSKFYNILKSDVDSKSKAKNIAKLKEDLSHNRFSDRVFVCLGTLNKDNDDRKHAWVMTIDETYQDVTFWEPLKPISYTLKGRIKHEESQWLKHYLSPELSAREKSKINKKERKEKKEKDKKLQEELEKQAEAKDKAYVLTHYSISVLICIYRKQKEEQKDKIVDATKKGFQNHFNDAKHDSEGSSNQVH